MDEIVSEEILNDNSKLELKVLRALSRLQKKTVCSGKLRKKEGITLMQIVKYLKANYQDLDGDVVTQVITALVQCIKNGLVCALDNGRYLHLGAQTKTMISNCFARTIHGTGCCCAKKVPCPNACCTINVNIRNKGVMRKRKCNRRMVNVESPKRENKVEDPETSLCDNCSEIHPVSNQFLKKASASAVRKTYVAPFDIFSPRDEINYNTEIRVRKK